MKCSSHIKAQNVAHVRERYPAGRADDERRVSCAIDEAVTGRSQSLLSGNDE